MFTSGSTGQAKGTLIEHKSIIRLAIGADYCHLGPDSTILQLAPVSFDAATFEIWAALLNGGCLVIPPPRTLGLNEIGGAIRDHRVNTAFLTTALFHAFVDQAISELAGLRQLLVGGEVTSPAHVRRFCERHPSCQFIHVYGPTENTTFSTFHPVTAADFDGKPLAIGRPIAHTDVFLLNEDGQLAGVGEEGELCTGGMGLARGYLNRPDLNARQFVDHPLLPGERVYRSGDIARLRPDGNIDFIGRRDHQVKISGFRVELGEVECAILSCEGITQTCPIALRAPSGDKYLAAAVVASRLIDPAAVQREMAARFPEFLIPSSFKQVPSMPLNENGKIDRKAIEKLWERPLAFPAAPHASTEDKICAVWTEVLQLENPPRTINFFDLGGRSLHWIRVQSELRRRYGFAVEVTDLFRAPTIESLAALIGNAADAAPETAADANRAANSARRAANQREALLRNKQRIVCGANPRINP